MDAEEHPSSKDPTIEELQEPHIPEDSLESYISETTVEPHVSKSPLVLPTSKTPSETHTFETLLDAHTSETSLKHSVSDTPPKTPMYEVPVESQISKGPEKHLSSNPLLENYVSASSSEDYARLREDLYSEVLRARKSTLEAPEPEIPKKHSLSGPSAEVHKDTSTGQQKKADEDKEGMVAIDSTAHTTQPGHQLGKKKGKNAASRYTVHPLVPAKQAELAEVAKVNHKDQFGTQVNHLFQWEKHAALSAIQTGLYIGWRCPHYHWDCFRIGDESKCFCGHLLKEHQIVSDISVPCGIGQCRCLMFCFIPSRPEEVGEFWLTRRATFDPKAWRAQCRCKHSHEDHIATGSHPCRRYGCYCSCFESNFLCAACDRRWEEHETFFETEKTRRRGGRPHGADYVPFAEMPALQEIILRNSDVKASESQGPSGHSSSYPGPPELPGPHSSQPSSTSDPYA